MAGPLTTKSRVVIAIVAITAAAFFGLGLLAGGLLKHDDDAKEPPGSAPPAVPRLVLSAPTIGAGSPSASSDSDADGPKILFDPSSINLLPDASLHLELPDALDAGLAP